MRYITAVLTIGLLTMSPRLLGAMLDGYVLPMPDDTHVTQLIVKLAPEERMANGRVMTQSTLSRLIAVGGIPLEYKRPMFGGAHVIKLPFPMTAWQAQEFATTLSAQGNIAFAEVDRRVYPMAAVTPNDPEYSSQWHLQDPTQGNLGAANLPRAWGEMGSTPPSITVAVVDTGILDHTDLNDNLVSGTTTGSGYDFIHDTSYSNDGNGRDNDPSDPGDWNSNSSLCSISSSSWHGTHVAGTIAATGNNAQGVAGINWTAKVLNARVLGRCGGYISDVADAIAWSAGETIQGVPTNNNPAKVINLSLGSAGDCSSALQTAINTAVARGAVIVVAAGNEASDINAFAPANCANVITTTALSASGNLINGSNYGTLADIAAPGENILSTHDTGTHAPNHSNTYNTASGTSMAAAHVSGVVSLMFAIQPALSNGTIPAAQVASTIENLLKKSARSFPNSSNCRNTQRCGAGILDAYQAVVAARQLTGNSTETEHANDSGSNGNSNGIVSVSSGGGGGGSFDFLMLFGLVLASIIRLRQHHRRNNT